MGKELSRTSKEEAQRDRELLQLVVPVSVGMEGPSDLRKCPARQIESSPIADGDWWEIQGRGGDVRQGNEAVNQDSWTANLGKCECPGEREGKMDTKTGERESATINSQTQKFRNINFISQSLAGKSGGWDGWWKRLRRAKITAMQDAAIARRRDGDDKASTWAILPVGLR
jgi:hypothetical protein